MDFSRRDLFSYLIEDSLSQTDDSLRVVGGDLVIDPELAIRAGRQTTASTTSALLFLWAKHLEICRKLRKEIDSTISSGVALPHSVLEGKPYLERCINEVMRLYPAVLSGVPRETGPKGLTIDGVFISPFNMVSVPTYAIHRGNRGFYRSQKPQIPQQFISERWMSKSDLIIKKEAFIPFSFGPYACAKKGFAMVKIRLLITTIVRNFEFRFPPGQEQQ
ncbi:uncharacterized protein ATNIH1004_008534 [Aspergillus tanneri]|uniref:Cytochrome P450 n=1 Tax=Aspergillus tanneri TaxID=1220188 RepID=A0A5M9MH53_9EURO|nr:uncharacterized protein ATNIH1004_008534 [Aspergillus tanneri]KAA8644333.1 hypothetical protein ATNIH1004_008534 [Aspergillus tanneri]